jgi:hypothetical protein
VNLDNFFNFIEENNLKNIQLNSAQLIIDGVPTSDFAPPRALGLRRLDENNYLKKLIPGDAAEERENVLFAGLLTADYEVFSDTNNVNLARGAFFDDDSVYYAVGDAGNALTLNYESDKGRYSGFLTLFFQRLFRERENATRLHNFVLYPTDPSVTNLGAKSVNRVIFPSDKVTLRIFYSEPTINQD